MASMNSNICRDLSSRALLPAPAWGQLPPEQEGRGLHSSTQRCQAEYTFLAWRAACGTLTSPSFREVSLQPQSPYPEPSQLSAAPKPECVLPGWSVSRAGFIGLCCFVSWWPDL